MSMTEATNGAARGALPVAVAMRTSRILRAGYRALPEVSAISCGLEAAVLAAVGAAWKQRAA